MTRHEWQAKHRHLRQMLRDRPKLEAVSIGFQHNGKDWTARLCRCPNCKGQPADLKPSMIRERTTLQRQADEWRWIAQDRANALGKLRYRTDAALIKRGYRRGIEFLRDLRVTA